MTERERYNNYYNNIIIKDNVTDVALILKRAAKLWPNKIAYICDDKKITYKELYINACNLSNRLKELGLKSQDRVILLYQNSLDFFIAYFGAWQAGGVISPLNIFLKQNEVENIISNAQPKAIIVSDKYKENIGRYIKDLGKEYIYLNDKDIQNVAQKKEMPKDFKIVNRDKHQMAALIYTSGTTGSPKGVMLSSYNIIMNVIQGVSRLDIDPKNQDRIYCALPLFHSLPQNLCVWATTMIGTTAIIVPEITRKSLLNGLKHKPQIIFAVPSLYGLFCLINNADFSHVRYFISGGDALSDKIRALFNLIYRRKICNGYGLTETSPFLSIDMESYTKPTNNIGKLFIGTNSKITDDKGALLSQGQVGILWVKGPNVMLGYYKDKEKTDKVIKDGWFCTGDLAYIDENENIVIVGREKDLIIHKGINIYPQEIENVLLTYNKVYQAAVIGIESNGTEIPIAFIATNEKDHNAVKEQLKSIAKTSLASYKIPRKFYVKSSLPMTATGKIDKKLLKKEVKQ